MCSARSTGVLNAVGSMSVVAMPFTFPAMAMSMALTMSEVAETDEPVHCGLRDAEDRSGVLQPVLGGGEEGVGGHVVDERELVGGVLRRTVPSTRL